MSKPIPLSMIPAAPTSQIGESFSLEGNITASEPFKLGGHIRGNLKGKKAIHVLNTGKVEGHVSAEQVKIDGNIEGNIEALQSLTIGESAMIVGDLVTPPGELVIESGASVSGRCHSLPTKEITPSNPSQTTPKEEYATL